MEESKQNPLMQGLNGISRGFANGVRATVNFIKKIIRKPGKKRRFALAVFLVLIVITAAEIKTSLLEAWCFTWIAGNISFPVKPGPDLSLRFPKHGPYDQRLGYTRLPDFISNLGHEGYRLEAQAHPSSAFETIANLGLNPIYHEKTQAGLSILSSDGNIIFKARHPERIIDRYESLAPLIVHTLLFIENRELLDAQYADRNPSVEWDRLTKAVIDRIIHIFDPGHSYAGGSTLATQIEKFRHSPDGRTTGAGEKLRQILSASLRAYRNGRDTTEVRRELVVSYLNSVPLSAFPGYGEIHGISDGLWAAFGANFQTLNRRLGPGYKSDEQTAEGYKQILSLMIAQRRPSYYLGTNRFALEPETNAHLRLLCKAGIITPALQDSALRVHLKFLEAPPELPSVSFIDRKAANTIRRQLLKALDLPNLYDLDGLDLSVKTTLNSETQTGVNRLLLRLHDPNYTKAAGLHGRHLLDGGDPGGVTYSFTLYERTGPANLVRIQTDNFDQPFDVNEGIKMELGSTAKLRTLLTYMEIIAGLHERYSRLPREKLRKVRPDTYDRLSRWALDYLLAAKNTSLSAMLESAMDRRYPANPEEVFFTGGGQHIFHNFDREDNTKIISVREGFRKSVNLVFIRLMRDIVHHLICLRTGSMSGILEDENNPSRVGFLERFADSESRVFLNRFYNQYRGRTSEEQLQHLLHDVRPTPGRLALIFRYLEPNAGPGDFSSFLLSHLRSLTPSPEKIEQLYFKYGPEKFNLQDRGYLARLHPLELWLVAYLRAHPAARRDEVLKASADPRREIYGWLLNPHRKSAQNIRIRTIMEMDAFEEILRSWKKTGYPFDALVPSYATAIGSSADRPASLAELVGIILNQGVRYPVARIDELLFASGTPYETLIRRKEDSGTRVLSPEIANVLRNALIDTVEKGTAQQVRGAFISESGSPLAVGGKTGTGDNRYETMDKKGQIIKSRVVNRAAVFVFFIGDRFFGTITAYVAGPEAADYDFTSSLPVRILKLMAPRLMPVIEPQENTTIDFTAPRLYRLLH